MITRRALLAVIASTPLLASCANIEDQQKLAQVASDVGLIADALAGVLPALGSIEGVDPELVGQIGQYVAQLKALAENVKNANDTGEAQTLITNIVKNVQAVLAVVRQIPAVPSNIQTIVDAVNVLLPVIAAVAGIFLAAPRTMTPEEARRILRHA